MRHKNNPFRKSERTRIGKPEIQRQVEEYAQIKLLERLDAIQR